MVRFLIALLVFASCGALHAAPLVQLALEGRTYGSNDDFKNTVPVQLGDTVEYRLRLFLGAPTVPLEDLRRVEFGTILHGVSSLSLGILQDPLAGIQVDFALPATLTPDSSVGANDGWANHVGARLRVELAADGSLNENLKAAILPRRHGLNSLSISIVQNASDAIQADFGSAVDLRPDGVIPGDGWGRGVGSDGGTLSHRSGTIWHDLLAIRPIHAPGVFTAYDDDIVFTGMLYVAAISGPSGQVRAEWGPWSGGGSFHGDAFWPTGPNQIRNDCFVCSRDFHPTESGPDPLTHFTPLTLTAAGFEAVPEPSTFALLGAAVTAFAFLRRSRVCCQLRLRDPLKHRIAEAFFFRIPRFLP